jgi:hypothetical protein
MSIMELRSLTPVFAGHLVESDAAVLLGVTVIGRSGVAELTFLRRPVLSGGQVQQRWRGPVVSLGVRPYRRPRHSPASEPGA